jgi:serine protease Do
MKIARYCWGLVIGFSLIFALGNSSALTAQQVYAKVKGSVYTLYSYNFKTKRAKGRGSAVAIGKHILATNCHIALSGNYLLVKVNEKPRVARLFYKDEEKDLCLLEVPKADFTPVKMRNSDSVKIGEVVYAIGNPRGTERTLSKGIISNKHKVKGGVWLQTDAQIHFGSSGGGLFDKSGQLIGITTKMGGNFGFAIPTEWILQVLAPKKIKTTEKTQAPSLAKPHKKGSIDYRPAYANLKHLGTYGRNHITLYRNNRECFISIPGRGQYGKIVGLTLWNPRHPNRLVIFPSSTKVKKALSILYKSIVERKTKTQSSYRSENILYLGGHPYRLYGARTTKEKYPFFIARFDKSPMLVLEKIRKFTVWFHDPDPRIGNENVVYKLDGFDNAMSSFYKECKVK